MRRLAEFTKTTLIGGILIVLPVYLSVLLLLKTLAGVVALIRPLTSPLPAGTEFREPIAAVLLLAVCFVAGVVVRTSPGLRAKNAIEGALLERIPGYTLIRGLAGRIAGRGDTEAFAVALVELHGGLVPGFIVELHEDGRYTVFIPSVPTPAAGAVYILPPERVHPVDVPFTQAVSVISRWGTGAKDLAAAMKSA